MYRTYLKIKSYRRKPVSSDFSILHWYRVIRYFYVIKRQRHWIPGQARNDKITQKTYFEISCNKLLFYSCLLSTVCCLLFLWGCGKKGDPTLTSYEKPEAPSVLKAIHRESEIIISWEFPSAKQHTIKGFHLFKSTADDFHKIAFLENDKRSYTDTDFTTRQEYHYKIVSESLKGITNDSVVLSLKPIPPPPAPGKLRFDIHHGTLTLSWEVSGDSGYYNIYKSLSKGRYALTPLNPEPVRGSTFQDSFDINRTVYYVVRSSTGSAIWDEGPQSEELAVDPLELIPSSPRTLTAVPTSDKIFLVWQESQETWVTGYKVYRETDKQEGYHPIGLTYTPAFIDREDVTVRRNYRITALGPSKEGPPAEIRNVVYEPPK
jgi:fibronectin type 3 domain-containing protein